MSLLLASGVGGSSITGTINIVLDDVVVACAAQVGHGAALSAALDDAVISCSVVAGRAAQFDLILDGDQLALSGSAGRTGTLGFVLDDISNSVNAFIGHHASIDFNLDVIQVDIQIPISKTYRGGWVPNVKKKPIIKYDFEDDEILEVINKFARIYYYGKKDSKNASSS